MASYHARQRDPLLDQNMQAMLERRGRELLGIGLLIVAFLFMLILGTYSPEDPGWMVATDEPAQNALGRIGAAISSTLMIIAGKGSWGLPIVAGAWGARFLLHRGEERALGRIVFAVIAIALGSIYAATHVPGPEWTHSFGLGGLFGDTVLGALLEIVPLPAAYGLKLLSLLVGGGLVAMGLFVCGFDLRELRQVTQFLLVGLVVTYNAALQLAGRGSVQAAQLMQERIRAHREGRAAVDAAAIRGEARAEAMPRPRSRFRDPEPEPEPAPRMGFLSRLRAQAPDEDAEPVLEEAAWGRPATLRADTTRPAAVRSEGLRAEPRHVEPAPAPAQPRTGLLARMPQIIRRVADPEAELVEHALSDAAANAEGPTEDRIKARINDVIRSRVRQSTGPLSPIAAAIARREPPLARRRSGPAPMVASRRAPMELPPEPPVVAGAGEKIRFASGMVASRIPGAATARLAVSALEADAAPAHAPRLMAEAYDAYEAYETGEPILTAREQLAYADEDEAAAYDEAYAAEEEVESYAEEEAAWLPHEDFDDNTDWTPEPAAPVAPVMAPVMAPKPAAAPAAKAPSVRPPEAQPKPRFEEQETHYELPPLSLLACPSTIVRNTLSVDALKENARMLESVLEDYGVKGEIVDAQAGPVVTLYELEPAPGLKASRVIGLADDIARSMSALSARVSTVPGRTVIGIELPNVSREKVILREILAARDFGDSSMRLPLALGKDIAGRPVVANLAKMPHLLIAGTTGSGKSVAINTMILSLLYKLTPEECRLIMIDPKMLELSVYDGIPHLLSPVVTDPKKAVVALKWVVGEMEERYRKMSKLGVRNIEGYNGRVSEALEKGEMFKRTIQTGFDEDTGEPVFETEDLQPVRLPFIVVVVDEMADLMMVAGKEIEACIQRLAQMARASGIHLIMATQRPSVDVITGTIKANFPTRISFQVTSKIDSRTILGEQGAEQLLGMGDMLYMAGGAKITRIHGPFVSDEEVEEIVNHLKSFGPPKYMSGVVEGPEDDRADDIDAVLGLGGNTDSEDALYDQAVAIVAKDRKCSTSYIQRKLGIGYNKAARLVEQMEEQGVVTAANHVGKREILLPEQ
ncbi:S-DNA-T family DNA segregation ATPase FtsK/SpoIIIE [Cereibacter johrii]|uniref:DNA translocase FtsK n=3 Tax=Cereibacter johrii TaxID=445629 RepID=A0ABX5J4Y8_9RHOB|nr:DNA translocase FtsK 4TM domain-containing protein [Cereibacter johrii]PTM76155.1 S-DNA-T family DNA segregation ATPase FtsK/SpoIIIE [Cereibacter johrii]